MSITRTKKVSEDAHEYRWFHDKIQEAAMSMVPKEDIHSFGGKVGRVLIRHLDDKDLEEAIFTAVNLLNEDPPKENEAECIKLATFNLRAAKKASHYPLLLVPQNMQGKESSYYRPRLGNANT